MRSVKESYREVLSKIDAACDRSGRDPAQVRLVAVSKTRPSGSILRLVQAGHRLFGENRVQEALGKMDSPELNGSDLSWHLIGHLQKNKVRYVVGRFDLIHSVDSPALAQALDRRAGMAGVTQPVLLQVNQAGETTKSGVRPEELDSLARQVVEMEHLDLQGLMTIPPPSDDPEQSRRWFQDLRRTRDRLAEELVRPLPELSMGMSGSYPVAVEEGATLVRVGTALFGPRDPA